MPPDYAGAAGGGGGGTRPERFRFLLGGTQVTHTHTCALTMTLGVKGALL